MDTLKNNGVGFGVLTVGATADKANLLGKQKSILESTKFFAPKIPPQLVGCWLDTDSEVSDGFSFFSQQKSNSCLMDNTNTRPRVAQD